MCTNLLRNLLWLSAVALLLCTARGSDVIVATESSFDDLVEEGFAMVKFYAPWCGHCKNLAPHWEEAATQLKGQAKFIKVDATVESALASKFEIQGYPTIKVFHEGSMHDYDGGRSANDLVNFVKRRLAPTVELIKKKEQFDILNDSDVVVILYTRDEDGESLKLFTEVAKKMRDSLRFAAVLTSVLFEDNIEGDIVVRKSFEDEPAKLTLAQRSGEDAVNLEDWIRSEAFPLINEIGPENYRNYIERGLPIAWLFVEDSTSDELPKQLVLQAAQQHKGKLSFVYLDGNRYRQLLSRYGFKGERFPLFVIESAAHFWSFPEDKTVTAEALETFCAEYVSGTLSRTILSEPIPENATERGLTTVVGHTVQELVLKSKQDVLIEFYAPWCGHCKKLAPIYEEVAAKLESVESVLVAKMDATANEVPEIFQVSGFPTIYFKPAGKEALLFEGERTVDGFLNFVKKHSSVNANESDSSSEAQEL